MHTYLAVVALGPNFAFIIKLHECGEYDEANQQLSLAEC